MSEPRHQYRSAVRQYRFENLYPCEGSLTEHVMWLATVSSNTTLVLEDWPTSATLKDIANCPSLDNMGSNVCKSSRRF